MHHHIVYILLVLKIYILHLQCIFGRFTVSAALTTSTSFVIVLCVCRNTTTTFSNVWAPSTSTRPVSSAAPRLHCSALSTCRGWGPFLPLWTSLHHPPRRLCRPSGRSRGGDGWMSLSLLSGKLPEPAQFWRQCHPFQPSGHCVAATLRSRLSGGGAEVCGVRQFFLDLCGQLTHPKQCVHLWDVFPGT